MTSIYELYARIVVRRGGVVTATDSISNFLQSWLRAEGGTPMFSDSPNDLLRRIAARRGVATFSSDSNTKILQRLAGLGAGNSRWDCLTRLSRTL